MGGDRETAARKQAQGVLTEGPPDFPAALLFDLDGTLVDTMPIHYEAYRRVFEEIGVVLTRNDFMRAIGGTALESIPRFLNGQPSVVTVEEIHRRKIALAKELVSQARPRPLELAKLLDPCKGRFRLGLVTSGAREGVRQILDAMGWLETFDVVITGSDVRRGKPAPDPFRLAARLLEVAPSACLVFEDTDAGVAAGKAAGMRVVDVRRVAAPEFV